MQVYTAGGCAYIGNRCWRMLTPGRRLLPLRAADRVDVRRGGADGD